MMKRGLYEMKIRYIILPVLICFLINISVVFSQSAGEKWAVVIGISNYSDKNLLPLKYPETDAEEFKRILVEHGAVPEDNIKYLTGSNATRENIKNSIYEFLGSNTLPEDEVYIFFSGYGTFIKDKSSDEQDGLDECLIPYDGKISVKENNYILDDDLSYWLKNIKSRNVVLVFDSEKASGMDDFVSSRGGVSLISTSDYNQIIREDKDLKNGTFMHFFLKELMNQANNDNNEILLKDLFNNVRKQVIEYSKSKKYELTPVIKGKTDNEVVFYSFPIALWEGAAGIIAFTSDLSGNRDIYLMNSDGSSKVNITRNSMEDFSPVWAIDGSKLAFISNRTGNFDVFSVDINGKNLLNLTDSRKNNYMPSWSPDGEFLAYTSRAGGTESIYIVKSDGTAHMQITTGTSWKDTNPSWFPDGEHVAFLSNRSGINEIYTVNLLGTELVNLTCNDIDETNFLISPQGDKIAFLGRSNGQVDLYIMNFDGSSQKNLTIDTGTEYDFSWSPDGKKIAFTSTEDTKDIANLCMVDIDTEKITYLTKDNKWKRSPAWSPDGTSLIYCAGTQVPTHIYGLKFDGTDPVKLVGGNANNQEPAWSDIVELEN